MVAVQQHPVPARPGEPHYGAGPVIAIKRGFAQYVQFDGRASLSEFWWYLFSFVVTTAPVLIVGLILASTDDSPSIPPVAVVFVVLALVLVIAVPSLAVASRRLHDAGFSALFLLTVVVTGLIVLVLCAFPTSPNGDQYAVTRPRPDRDPRGDPYGVADYGDPFGPTYGSYPAPGDPRRSTSPPLPGYAPPTYSPIPESPAALPADPWAGPYGRTGESSRGENPPAS